MTKKILVVEDDVFLLNLYGSKLRKEGYDVFLLENGIGAVSTAKKYSPDLIILDLVMPIKDGFNVLKELKADSTTENIPVVIVSKLGLPSDKKETKDLGASAHIVKLDHSFDDILKEIKKYL